MDETEFRILDTLSRDPDRQISISGLTREIQHLHGTAHYPNTYRALQEMKQEGIVDLAKTGSASMVSLNLRNPQTIDSLSEMELHKRHALSEKREEFQRLSGSISDSAPLGPIALIDPERNLKLNRAELVILLPEWAATREAPEALRQGLESLEAKLDIRIDALALGEIEFRSLLAARDRNSLKEMLSKQTTILAPDLFWGQIRNAWAHGIQVHFDAEETNPAKIPDRDIIHNLARFGYTEFGPKITDGRDIGIEYIVTALLLGGDARRVLAVPTLLAKNQASYTLLLFLSRKYGTQAQLLGLMQALAKYKKDPGLREAIQTLERNHIDAAKVSEAAIEENLRTYNAIKQRRD